MLMSGESECCELNKLNPEEVNKILDLLERMSTGKPAGWKSRAQPLAGATRFCPYFEGSAGAEPCQNGCRLKELIEDDPDL